MPEPNSNQTRCVYRATINHPDGRETDIGEVELIEEPRVAAEGEPSGLMTAHEKLRQVGLLGDGNSNEHSTKYAEFVDSCAEIVEQFRATSIFAMQVPSDLLFSEGSGRELSNGPYDWM